MRTEVIQVWGDVAVFESRLNETIKMKEPCYEIIDIKYSTIYDSLNQRCNYSALILFKSRRR